MCVTDMYIDWLIDSLSQTNETFRATETSKLANEKKWQKLDTNWKYINLLYTQQVRRDEIHTLSKLATLSSIHEQNDV